MVIYTRNATCAPIRAEEGITGVLCPPNGTVSFRDLPEDQQIGGYPTLEQLKRPSSGKVDSESGDSDDERPMGDTNLDAAVLDSEGRSVVLEFPAFVLIGVYCPANRDESRDDFRLGFLNALDARIRNLTAMGKRVFVTGDINIAKQGIDSASAMEGIRKGTMTEEEHISRPSRRLFNSLLSDGVVVGERDKGREQPVLHDICRSFHPNRAGMYTCWDTRLNTRPGNYGARIDYVLCSLNMQDWFSDSNIQEGLMVRLAGTGSCASSLTCNAQGSDHCPVYAVFKDQVSVDGELSHIRDIMNPPGMFKDGKRQQEYSSQCLLPASGRRLPEFDVDKRRSIKDMFSRKPPSTLSRSASAASAQEKSTLVLDTNTTPSATPTSNETPNQSSVSVGKQDSKNSPRKRSQPAPAIPAKRSKSTSTPSGASSSGQKSLKGFFKPKSRDGADDPITSATTSTLSTASSNDIALSPSKNGTDPSSTLVTDTSQPLEPSSQTSVTPAGTSSCQPSASKPKPDNVIDPIVSKEDWSKIFTKKPVPLCDSHQEPCISLTTKKPGMNRGRVFWICPRPLGPSGEKEKGTQWRCPTFIWASDWNSSTSAVP